MEVKDFLTTYPNYGPQFENDIFHLKEFNIEKLDPAAVNPISGLWKHQKVLARFMSADTPYNSLLVIHQVGTGKTCAAFAIAEANKKILKKTIFLSPSQDLNRQQRKELIEQCFPKEYEELRRRLKDGKRINYNRLPYYKFSTPQTLGNIVSRMSDEAIRRTYSNTLFILDEVHKIKPYENVNEKKKELEKKRKLLAKLKLNKDPQSNINNLEKEIKTLEKQIIQTYIQLQKVFRIANNIKIVLLTATPMIDKASEIIGIMNLILPKKQHLKKEDWRDSQLLSEAIRGRVSFLKAVEISTPKKFIEGYYKDDEKVLQSSLPEKLMKHIKDVNINLISCLMSEVQTNTYLQAWCEAIFNPADKTKWKQQTPSLCHEVTPPKRQKSLAYGAEQASLLIIGGKGNVPKLEDKTLYGSKIKKNELSKFLNKIKTLSKSGGKSFLGELYNYAPKYSLTLQKILDSYEKNKKVFIYIRSVSGGGANALKVLLENVGYADVTFRVKRMPIRGRLKQKKIALKQLPTTEKKRFIFLTGDTNIDKAAVINIFNSPKNATGKYIQVIVGTDTITQGFSIKDVQEMHVHDPPWNYPTLEQAIGRIIRRDSHIEINKFLDSMNLPPAEVSIYLYNALPNLLDGVGKRFFTEQQKLQKDSPAIEYWNSIDLKKYSRMSSKDRDIKSVEKILKENAFDCPLFYNRNIRLYSPDGSRECEYDICKYSCKGMDMDEIIENKPIDLVDVNYELLYNKEDIQRIIEILITDYLPNPQYSILSIEEMRNQIFKQSNYSYNTILQALNNIIQRPGLIKDKFGMVLILKEQNNVYYTTREHEDQFRGTIDNPILTQISDRDYVNEVGNSITKTIFCNKSSDQKLINKLLELETPIVKELIVENSISTIEVNAQTNLQKVNQLAENVAKSRSVEGFLIQDSDESITSSIIPNCPRTFSLDFKGVKSPTFCGVKVSWSPPYWKDKGTKSQNYIDENIQQLLTKALKDKSTFLGVGRGDKLIILKIDVLYPLVGNKRDINGIPSIQNLPMKKNKVNIDMRSVPSGRIASSYNANDLEGFLFELGEPATYSRVTSLVDQLEKSLKKQKIMDRKNIQQILKIVLKKMIYKFIQRSLKRKINIFFLFSLRK